jgi:hypothetical protein
MFWRGTHFAYVATQEDIFQIVAILKAMKQKMVEAVASL